MDMRTCALDTCGINAVFINGGGTERPVFEFIKKRLGKSGGRERRMTCLSSLALIASATRAKRSINTPYSMV